MDGYKELANAIILQAIEDYRENPKKRQRFAKKLVTADANLRAARKTNDKDIIRRAEGRKKHYQRLVERIDRDQREIECFFKSGWYEMLTDVDGDLILRFLHAGAKG